ncbi:MAG TPA: phosphate ABC transporter permease subunit PstC [Ktedonobacterales bacterium]|nr:phosphate ABC transporter permease subunit PstC [Ktedonobacterales bacterium]
MSIGALAQVRWPFLLGAFIVLVVFSAAGLHIVGGKAWRERMNKASAIAGAAVLIIAMAAILFFVGGSAYQTFTDYHVSLPAFFFGTTWNPDEKQVGALIMILGSITATVLAIAVATPLSVATAMYVTDIAPTWAKRLIQPILELFAGIPSVVYGFLGIQLIVPLVRNTYNGIAGGFLYAGFGVIAAALVLTFMILPTVTTLSIDALNAVPNGLREASLALGATRWQTLWRTLLPAGASGIFTGVILGMGRAIGETLAVAFVIGSNPNSFPIGFSSAYPYIVFRPTSTITVQLFQDFKEAPHGSLNYDAIWTLAFVLLLITLGLVIASRWISSRSAYRVAAE